MIEMFQGGQHHLSGPLGRVWYGHWSIIAGIVGLILIVVLIYFLTRGAKSGGEKEGRSLEILKERYAKGEMTKEQFEEARKELEK